MGGKGVDTEMFVLLLHYFFLSLSFEDLFVFFFFIYTQMPVYAYERECIYVWVCNSLHILTYQREEREISAEQ